MLIEPKQALRDPKVDNFQNVLSTLSELYNDFI
jgi:hypothetical protein